MNARTIARELALLALYQQTEDSRPFDTSNLKELTLLTVRAMQTFTQDQLEHAASDLRLVAQTIQDIQDEHPDNENVPFEQPSKPITLPSTAAVLDQLDSALQAADTLINAINFPEIVFQSNQEHVQNYLIMLFKNLNHYSAGVQSSLEKALIDWRLERLNKMDRSVLELAVSEMYGTSGVDNATIIDEFVELSKRYCDEESYKFINGILATVSGSLNTESESLTT